MSFFEKGGLHMMIAIWPLILAIAGALMYALSSNGKVIELGRIIFFCGMFFVTAALAGTSLRLP